MNAHVVHLPLHPVEREGSVVPAAPHGGLRIPKIVLPEPHGEPVWRLALFGGLHGDEPASVQALYRFADQLVDELWERRNYELLIYPVCNPSGCAVGTRENAAGVDLNREFWRNSSQPEVRLLERELRSEKVDGIITLHADDTSDGLYGFTFGRWVNEELLRPALAAASAVVPINKSSVIDGFAARDGLVERCYEGVLSPPPDVRPRPVEIVFETPGLAPLSDQVEAANLALRAILRTYRQLLSTAQNL